MEDIIFPAIICTAGLVLLAVWLLKTSFARNAFADSPPRLNSMPSYAPFIPLFIWFGAVSLALSARKKLLPDLPHWQNVFWDNLTLSTGAIISSLIIIFLARIYFADRLKGFGLNPGTIPKDLFAAVTNLISACPLVSIAFVWTIICGQLIYGPDFQMQQHEELKSITEHPQLSLRILIVVTAVIIVPAFEEMLFRGMFQTMIQSYLARPWLSILLTSGLFAVIHTNIEHWPALFVLATFMGYSYEKSGSLFRPIFIHSIFNGLSILAALCSA